jgi:hypothetical protein
MNVDIWNLLRWKRLYNFDPSPIAVTPFLIEPVIVAFADGNARNRYKSLKNDLELLFLKAM